MDSLAGIQVVQSGSGFVVYHYGDHLASFQSIAAVEDYLDWLENR